jgi:hypothetical protein
MSEESVAASTVDNLESLLPINASIMPIATLYPTLGCASFNDIIKLSTKFLNVHVARVAGLAALTLFATDPSTRLDLELVSRQVEIARSGGIRPLLATLSEALVSVSYQQLLQLPVDPRLTDPFVPPCPLPQHLQYFDELVAGSPIFKHPETIFSSSLPPAPDMFTALAVERLVAKDFAKGMVAILPFEEGRQLLYDAGIDFNIAHVFLRSKTDADFGRLIQHYSASGPNHDDKKTFLENRYSPIIYPTIAEICQTLLDVAAQFQGEEIVGFKSDLDGWFKRVRVALECAGMLSYVMWIHTKPYLVIPLTHQWGAQEANYISNLGSNLISAFVRQRQYQLYGIALSRTYSDDFFGFGPRHVVIKELSAIREFAQAVAGKGAVNIKKEVVDSVIDVLGVQFDVPGMMLSLTATLFLKLVCLFFLEVADDIAPGDMVSTRWLQRMGSYVTRSAAYLPFVAPFCQGAYANLAGVSHRIRFVPVKACLITDIHLWRQFLRYSFVHAEGLRIPVSVPPMVQLQRGEFCIDAAIRQSLAASVVIWVDACTVYDAAHHGIGWIARLGANGPIIAYGTYKLPHLTGYWMFKNRPDAENADINLLEFLGGVLALDEFVHGVKTEFAHLLPPSSPTSLLHVHIWTDNSSALSWMTTHRSKHACHTFLVHLYCHTQHVHRLVVTQGPVKGECNPHADAASRGFKGVRGQQLLAEMAHLLPRTGLPHWLSNIRRWAKVRSGPTSSTAVEALTTAVSTRS